MGYHSSVALVTSQAGETKLQEAIQKLEGEPLEAAKWLLENPDIKLTEKGDTLRIWKFIQWYEDSEEIRVIETFVQEKADEARLRKIFYGDWGISTEEFGFYPDSTFDVGMDMSFLFYKNGNRHTSADISPI